MSFPFDVFRFVSLGKLCGHHTQLNSQELKNKDGGGNLKTTNLLHFYRIVYIENNRCNLAEELIQKIKNVMCDELVG